MKVPSMQLSTTQAPSPKNVFKSTIDLSLYVFSVVIGLSIMGLIAIKQGEVVFRDVIPGWFVVFGAATAGLLFIYHPYNFNHKVEPKAVVCALVITISILVLFHDYLDPITLHSYKFQLIDDNHGGTGCSLALIIVPVAIVITIGLGLLMMSILSSLFTALSFNYQSESTLGQFILLLTLLACSLLFTKYELDKRYHLPTPNDYPSTLTWSQPFHEKQVVKIQNHRGRIHCQAKSETDKEQKTERDCILHLTRSESNQSIDIAIHDSTDHQWAVTHDSFANIWTIRTNNEWIAKDGSKQTSTTETAYNSVGNEIKFYIDHYYFRFGLRPHFWYFAFGCQILGIFGLIVCIRFTLKITKIERTFAALIPGMISLTSSGDYLLTIIENDVENQFILKERVPEGRVYVDPASIAPLTEAESSYRIPFPIQVPKLVYPNKQATKEWLLEQAWKYTLIPLPSWYGQCFCLLS
jgi:tetrahydromethanopterin S-methyltransferase subunit B